ncbi:hypothetical protein H920_03341 [Fukomys damarensis]|uniref:Uncharacterized protein n=1 Tax=Fukomys damarensis TaxID=885580 RepID=A0A091EID0_FUKDA|nr:hypothetical protein H920_03341 [Fukomys damarensis]
MAHKKPGVDRAAETLVQENHTTTSTQPEELEHSHGRSHVSSSHGLRQEDSELEVLWQPWGTGAKASDSRLLVVKTVYLEHSKVRAGAAPTTLDFICTQTTATTP